MSYTFETKSSLVETVTLRLVVIKLYHHKAVYTYSLADLGGRRARRTPPLWDPILSFSHTFSLKSAHVGGPRPPPTGNPGSATDTTVTMSIILASTFYAVYESSLCTCPKWHIYSNALKNSHNFFSLLCSVLILYMNIVPIEAFGSMDILRSS